MQTGVRAGFRMKATVAMAAAALMVVTACSSSGGSSSSSQSAPGSAGKSAQSAEQIKVGVIADLTGSGSSGSQTVETGIKAYVKAVNAEGGVAGHTIEYVMADSTSTPSGALTAAQKLDQRDHVFAVISVSAFFFGAEPYLLKQGIPVLGTGYDGPEWLDKKNTNMFNAYGLYDPVAVYTEAGEIMKKLGGTACGAVGYSESPSASGSAKAFVKSCEHAGLKNAYLKNIPFGTTDVGPIALGMKSKGVDAISMSTLPATTFALAAALRQNGVDLKAVLLPFGYGAELLKSGPGVKAAQGMYFTTQYQPSAMMSPATKKVDKRFAAVGQTLTPGGNGMVAYISMTAFARGLEEAGPSPTQQGFIAALRKVSDFDAEGLLSPLKVDFGDYDPQKQCIWISQLKGKQFHVVEGLDPICGTKLSNG